jgi:hypothetical protein
VTPVVQFVPNGYGLAGEATVFNASSSDNKPIVRFRVELSHDGQEVELSLS